MVSMQYDETFRVKRTCLEVDVEGDYAVRMCVLGLHYFPRLIRVQRVAGETGEVFVVTETSTDAAWYKNVDGSGQSLTLVDD
jgi:hypothetical protein